MIATYDRAAVARVANDAHGAGHSMAAAVANLLACSPAEARRAIKSAANRGQRINGSLRGDLFGYHGTNTGYRYGCRDACCVAAHRAARNTWRASVDKAPRTTPQPLIAATVRLSCACGAAAGNYADLLRHTLAQHKRTPTITERTPITARRAA